MSFRYPSGINKPGFNSLVASPAIVDYEGLYSWGRNQYGQLGQGDTTSRSSPTQIGALTTWLQAAGGETTP